MSLFLPHRGWLIKLARGCTPDDHPLGNAVARHALDVLARPFPEVLLAHAAKVGPLQSEPLVLSIKKVWFFGSADQVPLPEGHTGREEVRSDQRTLIYTAQNKALADLATSYEPVRLLLQLCKSGAPVRKLAREVLEGKLTSFEQLAATLERANHPLAAAVRQLSGGEPIARPAVPPSRGDDVELAEAHRNAGNAPCPECQSLRTRSVHRAQKEGPNHGRLFIKCRNCNRFEWVSTASPEGPDREFEAASAQATPCPQCGKPRRALRVRKEGRNHGRIFLGCCDRACDSFEWLSPAAVEPAKPREMGSRKVLAAAGVRPDEALLHAIATSPDDDLHRLVYADWLDENDQPERAELVRVQCELAKLPAGDPRGLPLRRRAEDLLFQYGDTWAAAVLPRVRSYAFRRGLLEHIELDAAGFAKHAEALFRAAPLQTMTVIVRGWQGARAVANSPQALRLRELRLIGTELHDAGARILATAADLANLRSLSLPAHNIGTGGLAALASSPHLANVTHLDLERNNIGRGGFQHLARSEYLSNLVSLNLNGASLDDGDFQALLAAPRLANLMELKIAGCGLTYDRLVALLASRAPGQFRALQLDSPLVAGAAGANLLADSPTLAGLGALSLRGWHVHDAGAVALARSPHLASLTALDLDRNALHEAGTTALAASPYLANLTTLDLRRNERLRAGGARALAGSPYLRSLTSLNLSACGLGAEGAAALAASPILANVRSLLLHNAHIGDEGAAALADSPYLGNLRELDLRSNDIGATGAQALAHSPNLQHLIRLDLGGNRVGRAGARAMADSPHLGQLRFLGLDEARIGVSDALALLESANLARLTGIDLSTLQFDAKDVQALLASPYLTRITTLNLSNNRLGDAGAQALAGSPHLAHLHFLDLRYIGMGKVGVNALIASPHLTRPGIVGVEALERVDCDVLEALQADARFWVPPAALEEE